jgi:hypothetical protein
LLVPRVLGATAAGVLASACFALGVRATTGCAAGSAGARVAGTGCSRAAVCFDLRPGAVALRAGAAWPADADDAAGAADDAGTGRKVVAALAACAIGVATFARP